MIIYEVNLQISPEIYERYISWLKPHVQEMLQFPGFLRAIILNELHAPDTAFKWITVQYTVESMAMLQSYLDNHAQKMREDGLARFSGKFSATRRVFEIADEIT